MAGVTLADLGGPVHPQGTTNADLSVSKWYGMSLRDYFAAAALQGLCASFDGPCLNDAFLSGVTRRAFDVADAMLAAREREEGSNDA
jgi:hypothetical protein